MSKLTVIEKRAKVFCDKLKIKGNTEFNIVWNKNQNGESNPRIDDDNGFKMAYAGGSGYCKESRVLSDGLRFLGDTEKDVLKINEAGNRGVDYVICTLDSLGWILERENIDKKINSYSIKRK